MAAAQNSKVLEAEAEAVVHEVVDVETDLPASVADKIKTTPQLPLVSEARRDQSLTERAFDINTFADRVPELASAEKAPSTVLYLAYGSNLAAKTFRGRRGIKPLAAINVVVPEIALTFDLPGVPYREPCFANVRFRRESNGHSPASSLSEESLLGKDRPRYHKTRWHKGLVGVVYEVSLEDYATIISTEGGGASYQDILVACHPLSDASTVPQHPESKAFKAHTLYAPDEPAAPATSDASTGSKGRLKRPDPNYAQPSARYRQLLLDGAEEHGLPTEYRKYLLDIRTYTVTETRQRIGQFMIAGFWFPVLMTLFSVSHFFADKRGRSPAWLSAISGGIFRLIWVSYDHAFRPIFGDGERTVGDD